MILVLHAKLEPPVKNTVRIGKRKFNNKQQHSNPNLEIGAQLWKCRENQDLTQWELASAVTEMLNLQNIVGGQIQDVLSDRNYPIAVDALEVIQFNLKQTLAELAKLRSFLQEEELQWINSAIAYILNVEIQIGRQLEQARREGGLTQEQLWILVSRQLETIEAPGPPGRAGISKIERGERRIDLLEAWAIAIVLKRPISSLLPPRLVKLLPEEVDSLSEWHPVAAYGRCRQYRGADGTGLASIACPTGVTIPTDFARKVFAGACG
jgi:transcriptional regulator with XRE-family HTH domain